MNLRNVLFVLALSAATSCTTVQQVGKVNMISNRNIDSSLDYSPLTTYSGGEFYKIRQTRATTIEEAVDRTVRNIPGGEFLMNVKIYLVNGRYFAVEGDVWGRSDGVVFKGFKVGDQVTWKDGREYMTGSITSLKDEYTCLIETDLGKTIEVQYHKLTKVTNKD